MPIPDDYTERVYAGVLGKLIGVYLGRPFEGWTYDRIMAELGEIWYYVHEQLGVPLIVTDDDISGTFTFIRALEDDGPPPGKYSGAHPPPTPTAEQIGAELAELPDRASARSCGGAGWATRPSTRPTCA